MGGIVIVGLGALAAAYAAQILDHHAAAPLRVLALGERAERLRRQGMVVNGRHYDLDVTAGGEPAAVVIVSVKDYDLAQALADLAGVVGPDTTFVSLLNGVSSEHVIQAHYPANYVPLALSIGSNCGRDAAGFRCYSLGRIQLGEPRAAGTLESVAPPPDQAPVRAAGGPGVPVPARVEALAQYLRGYALPVELPADMEHALWFKFVLNCGINQASALSAAPYRAYQQPGTEARALMLELMRETMAVAAANGTPISQADLEGILATVDALDPAGYASMATDARLHHRMEIEAFAGEVIRRAAAAGLATPVSTTVARVLRAQEETWEKPSVSLSGS